MLGNSHHINVFLWDGYIYISKEGGIGHWALGIGHWAMGIEHWALGIEHWALGIGHWALGIKEVFPRSLTLARYAFFKVKPLIKVYSQAPAWERETRESSVSF
jgi:hypothetical protein